MANLKLVCALVLCMLVAAPMAHALSCKQVLGYLSKCEDYLESNGKGQPSSACCNGVKELNDAATTRSERQQACQCLENYAKQSSGINSNAAASLPSKCGVKLPYTISSSTNCASIQ